MRRTLQRLLEPQARDRGDLPRRLQQVAALIPERVRLAVQRPPRLDADVRAAFGEGRTARYPSNAPEVEAAMRTPTLVFDYVNRVAVQLGKDAKADREAAKTLASKSKGVAKASGGRPAASS